MLDTFGSVVGPLILFGLLSALKDSSAKYHIILLVTAIPLFATLTILQFKVKETPTPEKALAPTAVVALPARFYWFLAIMLIFSLGNSSDAFLILRAQNLGIVLLAIPLVYALLNFVYTIASVYWEACRTELVGRK